MKVYTASQLAKQLGVTPQTITRNAALHGIGVKVSSVWLFQQSDIRKMRRILDDNYKRDFARMGRAAMAKRWHGKEVENAGAGIERRGNGEGYGDARKMVGRRTH